MQYYPVVIQGGQSLAGDSLGFHAYSLRIDNLTNQWLLEETSLAWIPPYSLGVCLRLYGTGVAIIINRAPVGQVQLAPVVGEQTIGVYSDQLRTEVGGTPVRQFTAVTTVTDLTQGATPATPPVGITRLYANSLGQLAYVLPSGVTQTVVDTGSLPGLVGPQPLGGDLYGTINAAHIGVAYNDQISAYDSGGTLRPVFRVFGNYTVLSQIGTAGFYIQNQGNTTNLLYLDASGNLTATANIAANGNVYYFAAIGSGAYWQWNGSQISTPNPINTSSYIAAGGSISMPRGQSLIWGDANTSIIGSASDNNITLNTWTALYVHSQGYGYNYASFPYPGHFQIYSSTIGFQNGFTYAFQSNSGTMNLLGSTLAIAGNCLVQGVGGSYAFTAPNAAATYGQGYANAWINASSKDFKKNVAPIDNPLGILLNPALRGVQYDHDWELPDGIRNTRNDPLFGTKHNIGFIADDWLPHVPEIVATDENGKAEGMDYARVTALLWEALREYITATNERLGALESARPQ